ncbi:MAG: hypothetical protein Q8K26_02235 [Candidatus Gracilibacteria bacterium]|nr:hypothetical protein [Candidatus Gracilibacteria bacterium]
MGRLDCADRIFHNNSITPHTYATMSEILSTDDKENKTIGIMKETEDDGYVLVGQLNADGTYDDYVKKYIRYAGTNEGLRSRARNQKAVIDGGMLKNDGTAFIFAKTSEFNRTMEKMKDVPENIMDILMSSTRDTVMGALAAKQVTSVFEERVNRMDILMGGTREASMGVLETEQHEKIVNMISPK